MQATDLPRSWGERRAAAMRLLREVHNDAADDLLAEALGMGNACECLEVLDLLIARGTPRGLAHVVRQYSWLTTPLRGPVLGAVEKLSGAIREIGRDADPNARRSALQLIRDARLGRLAHVATENLPHGDADVSRDAAETLLALADWVVGAARDRRRVILPPIPGMDDVQQSLASDVPAVDVALPAPRPSASLAADAGALTIEQLIQLREEIEAAVLRAFDGHRGRFTQDLLRAILLLTDSAASKTLTVLADVRLAGRANAAPVVRRLQQAPDAESAAAFLLGCTHARLRSHFGVAMSHVDDNATLDVLLEHTHWLKDNRLQLCMHQVNRGVWWHEATLGRDLMRRNPADSVNIAAWIAASGTHDVMQDDRLAMIMRHCRSDADARLRVLRHAMARRGGASVELLKTAISDKDETIARLAARELVRRRPSDLEAILVAALPTAKPTVSVIIRRAIGPRGFDSFWTKFDRLPMETRGTAGRALLKMIPASVDRLARRLTGNDDDTIKALQIAQECGAVAVLAGKIKPLLKHRSSRVRSKAVAVIGAERATVTTPETTAMVNKSLEDADARVRANAIEALEHRRDEQWLATLARHARSASGRERANAIKALMKLRVATAVDHLQVMLRDPRAEHRISGMWVLRQVGFWRLLDEVIAIARADGDLKARRFALSVLRAASDLNRPMAVA